MIAAIVLIFLAVFFFDIDYLQVVVFAGIGLITLIVVNYTTRQEDKKIVSAEVIDRTQVTREEYRHSGFSIGSRGGSRMYWRVKNVPSHVEVKLNVVYESGKNAHLTLIEGSSRYNRIMDLCEKRKKVPTKTTVTLDAPSSTNMGDGDYIEIKTNQLVAGVYIIGEAIPEGNYDLKWVWGSGSIHKYVDNTTTLGASNLFKWMGNTHDYEERLLMNIVCKEGEYLHVGGNLIVEIRKSKPVKIEL